MITKEEFDNLIEIKNTQGLRGGLTVQVYRFLLENKGFAYTSTEIAKVVHKSQNQIIGSLKHLHELKLIKNSIPYWTVDFNMYQQKEELQKQTGETK